MKTYTLPDGTYITYNGTLPEKMRILELLGINYNPTAEEIEEETRIQQFKNEYQNIITTLQQIENAGILSNVKLTENVKFLAKTVRQIMELLARQS